MVDDLVQKALARWPNVPAIAGWLKLTEQGDWLLTGPVPEGLTISNERILNFIARNYDCDESGRYFFQNGPQKAYVSLAVSPWVFRIYPLDNGHFLLVTHTGLVVKPVAMFADESGRLFFETSLGVGLLHGSDSVLLANALVRSDTQDFELRGTWEVPQNPDSIMPATRVKFRKLANEEPGTFDLTMPVRNLQSNDLPERFHFILEPEV
ncbi:MAG: DUF2946 family protein [Limnobacter sp.]|nr:DUF2946 family protein [Limnobacter sp.]